MKRIIALLLALMILASLAGCGAPQAEPTLPPETTVPIETETTLSTETPLEIPAVSITEVMPDNEGDSQVISALSVT